MRIGVDATCWANERGYGRFTRGICAAMVALAPEHEFVFFSDERAAERFDLRAANARLLRVELGASPTLAASTSGHRSLGDMLALGRAVGRERLDVFFSPSVYTYFPLPPRLRSVVTVHDTIAERFPRLTLPTWRARLFWRAKVRLALAQARLILTVSDFSAREIASVLRVPPARIRVCGEAPAHAFHPVEAASEITQAARRLGLPDGSRWFIYVGGFNPHKRVELIAQAHAALARKLQPPPHLLLVGTLDQDVFHGSQAQVRETIAREGSTERVRWTGFLGDDELRPLHAGAIALLLPSECEGFGLPAVEAAACGTPVVATLRSPVPELLEGGGIFVPPGDVLALAAAMERLATDESLRTALGRRALARARELTWPRGAAAALAALCEAAT